MLSTIQRQILQTIQKALLDNETNEFLYESDWTYDFPTHDFYVKGISLCTKYNLKDYTFSDLEALISEGLFIVLNDERHNDGFVEEVKMTCKLNDLNGRRAPK